MVGTRPLRIHSRLSSQNATINTNDHYFHRVPRSLHCYPSIVLLLLLHASFIGTQIRTCYRDITFIFQHANSGPFNLLLPTLGGFAVNRRSIGLLAMVLLMVFLIVVSQMFSTILLSDLYITDLRGGGTTKEVLYNLSNYNYSNYVDNGPKKLRAIPLGYPIFAERSDDRFLI